MNPTHALVRRAHPGRRARRGARGGDQRPDDHDLRSRRPHPAALDPPDPGDARGPGAAQRAERDVRGGDGVQHGGQAGGHPARAPHLRHHVLPGAGPDERLRRASVQGDPRLRPQPGRGRGDVRAGRAARGERAAASACWPRRATGATRTSARSAGSRRAASTTTSAAATTSCAAASRTRCRTCCARRCSRTACRPSRSWSSPTSRQAVDAALREAQPGDLLLHLRRRDHPELEAGHPVPPRGAGAAGRPAPRVAARAALRRPGAGAGGPPTGVRERLARRPAAAGGGRLDGAMLRGTSSRGSKATEGPTRPGFDTRSVGPSLRSG